MLATEMEGFEADMKVVYKAQTLVWVLAGQVGSRTVHVPLRLETALKWLALTNDFILQQTAPVQSTFASECFQRAILNMLTEILHLRNVCSPLKR